MQQVQALHQAKTQAAAQQAASEQHIADRQDRLRRETLEALCGSPTGEGLSDVLKRWPSPHQEGMSLTPDHPGRHGLSRANVTGSLDSTITDGGPGTCATTACSSTGGMAHECARLPAVSVAAAAGEAMTGGTQNTQDDDFAATGGTGCEPPATSVAAAAAAAAALASAGGTGHSPRDSLCRGKDMESSAPYLSEASEEAEVQSSAIVEESFLTGPMHVAVATEAGADRFPATPPPPPQHPREAIPRRQPPSARTTPTPRKDSPPRSHASPRGPPPAHAGKSQIPRPPAAASEPAPQPRCPSPAQQGRGRVAAARRERRSPSPSQSRLRTEFQPELDLAIVGLTACADTVSVKSFRELRQMSSPPEPVGRVFDAVLTLLGADDPRTKANIRRYLTVEKLKGLDLMRVSMAQFRRAQRLILEPGFSEEDMQAACSAAVPLVTWCRLAMSFLARTRFQGRGEVDPRVAEMFAEATPSSGQGETGSPGFAASLGQTEDADARGPAIVREREACAAGRGQPEQAQRSRSGYFVVTPDLSRMSPWDLKHVRELSVSRPDVGSILFHGTTDCTGLDIQSLVHFDVGEVLVYPMPGSKPGVGQGLNKRATVTMYQCWPPNGRGNLENEEAQQRYRRKIQQMTEEKRAKFIDYDCNTGVWKFQVEHF